MKKAISILLAVVMVISLLPTSIFAVGGCSPHKIMSKNDKSPCLA